MYLHDFTFDHFNAFFNAFLLKKLYIFFFKKDPKLLNYSVQLHYNYRDK